MAAQGRHIPPRELGGLGRGQSLGGASRTKSPHTDSCTQLVCSRLILATTSSAEYSTGKDAIPAGERARPPGNCLGDGTGIQAPQAVPDNGPAQRIVAA